MIILALCIYGIACDDRMIRLVNLFISACDKKIVTLLSDKMYVLNIYNTSFFSAYNILTVRIFVLLHVYIC